MLSGLYECNPAKCKQHVVILLYHIYVRPRCQNVLIIYYSEDGWITETSVKRWKMDIAHKRHDIHLVSLAREPGPTSTRLTYQ